MRILRFVTIGLVALIVSYYFAGKAHNNYWNRTIKHVQTIDINMSSYTMPFIISQSLIDNDNKTIKRIFESNFKKYGYVVTDCASEDKGCPDEKIILSSEAYGCNSPYCLDDLKAAPFDVLRDPPPLQAEYAFSQSYAETREATGQENPGKPIGRLYYMRGSAPSLYDDLSDWWSTPVIMTWLSDSTRVSGRKGSYSLILVTFLAIGFLVWVCFEFYLKRQLYQQEKAREQYDAGMMLSAKRGLKIDILQDVSKKLVHENEEMLNEIEGLKVYKRNALRVTELEKHIAENERELKSSYEVIDALGIEKERAEAEKRQAAITLKKRNGGDNDEGIASKCYLLAPSKGRMTSLTFRQMIGLEQALDGYAIKEINYHDNYFYEAQAKIFCLIFTETSISRDTSISIHTWDKENYKPIQSRKKEILNGLYSIAKKTPKINVHVSPFHKRGKHMREMQIKRSDGMLISFFLDKGLDFIKQHGSNFQIREETYIVKMETN